MNDNQEIKSEKNEGVLDMKRKKMHICEFMMCVSVKIYSLKSQNFIQQRLRLFKEWEQN